MTRTRKLVSPAVIPASPGAATDEIVQVKVWLLGISPMVWRRVQVNTFVVLPGVGGAWDAISGISEPQQLLSHDVDAVQSRQELYGVADSLGA